jgi:hypothetical protein
MTPAETGLLSRIEGFKFDDGDVELSFGRRLAKDNGWTMLYAVRVIEEYRRFAFLMVASGHLAVPSDQVDQAWHQHLLYTRSWADFCQNALRQLLHHDPTTGGAEQHRRFRYGYEQTLQSYSRFFGEPPEDIWPNVGLRFGRDLYFRRVSTKDNVVISRSWLWGFAVATTGTLAAAILLCLS